MGLALGSRSIECSIRSVAWMSCTFVAKQSFQVYSSRRVFSTRSGVSASGPMVIPLDATHVLISSGDASDKGRSTGRRSVGNPSPLPNEYLVTASFGVGSCKDARARAAMSDDSGSNAAKANAAMFAELCPGLVVP